MKVSSTDISDFEIGGLNTRYVLAVPATANTFSAQLVADTEAEIGTPVVTVKYSLVPDADVVSRGSSGVTRLWAAFNSNVALSTLNDFAADNKPVAASWLAFIVTTAATGVNDLASVRLYVEFHNRPGAS